MMNTVIQASLGLKHVKMRSTLVLLAIGMSAVAASPTSRIIGGSIATITQYPMAVAMLYSSSGTGIFSQTCVGTILTNRAVLSAAHCYSGYPVNSWRARVGSARGDSGGVVHNVSRVIIHPQYNSFTYDNDVVVIHVNVMFSFNNNVRAGSIAGSNYILRDNDAVTAIGWGATSYGGLASQDLRHVQIWVVNQAVCRQNYASLGRVITDNMLCAGWINVGGRDQCRGDAGSPLLHGYNVVGVASFGQQCGLPRFPGVNVRVSRVSSWISVNV